VNHHITLDQDIEIPRYSKNKAILYYLGLTEKHSTTIVTHMGALGKGIEGKEKQGSSGVDDNALLCVARALVYIDLSRKRIDGLRAIEKAR